MNNNINNFPIGTVVVLNSGGPKMTITTTIITNNEYATCRWFTKTDDIRENVFNIRCLKKVLNNNIEESNEILSN